MFVRFSINQADELRAKVARRRLARCMPADDLANILTALAEQYERNAIELEAELWSREGAGSAGPVFATP